MSELKTYEFVKPPLSDACNTVQALILELNAQAAMIALVDVRLAIPSSNSDAMQRRDEADKAEIGVRREIVGNLTNEILRRFGELEEQLKKTRAQLMEVPLSHNE